MPAVNPDFQEIPIIDVGPLIDNVRLPGARRKVAEQIRNACQSVGFFYIRNHGVPQNDRDALFVQAKRFFALPTLRKMDIYIGKSRQHRGYIPLGGEVTDKRKDWHEALDFGADLAADDPDVQAGKPLHGPNQWPKNLPGFRTAMTSNWDLMIELGSRLTEGLALSLGLEADFFAPFTSRSLSDWRLIHYPAASNQEGVGEGIGEHVDYGFVTILAQDEVGGLEVRNASGQWIAAPYIADTFIVNIGHMVQRWTNDRYEATWHRVRSPRQKERLSIPFFYSPSFDTVVEPLPSCCDASNPPRYEPCHFGEYSVEAFGRSYAELSSLE